MDSRSISAVGKMIVLPFSKSLFKSKLNEKQGEKKKSNGSNDFCSMEILKCNQFK